MHLLFAAKFDRAQDGGSRTKPPVGLAKNIDRAALTEGFKACLA